MPLQNLLEGIVDNIVEDILRKEGDYDALHINKDDIVAYVLNRVPPQYVTSERGILHGQIASKYKIQQKTDIIIGVYEAIDIIKKRRGTAVNDTTSVSPIFNIVQHIVGSIADEETLSPVYDAQVSLLFGGEVIKMVDSNWVNPYVTNTATRGYYHFWPAYSSKKMGNESKLAFTIKVEHAGFETTEREIQLEVNHDYSDDMPARQAFSVPMILLKLK
jgi:competence protein ComFB